MRFSVFAILMLSAGVAVATDVSNARCDGGNSVDVPGVGCFSNPDSTLHYWSETSDYCSKKGGGYYLPSKDQLVALYNAYPNNQMNTTLGWPTDGNYWSSTQYDNGIYYDFSLYDGVAGRNYHSIPNYVVCVR